MEREIGRDRRSLAVLLVGVAVTFVAVPVVLYSFFAQAPQERQDILTHSIQAQSRIVATAISPLLVGDEPTNFAKVIQELARFSKADARIRLLFRKRDATAPTDFQLVGAAPQVDWNALEREQQALVAEGLLNDVARACAGSSPAVQRYQDGQKSSLASILPVVSSAGCWAIVFSYPAGSLTGEALAAPFWQRSEVQRAAIIYFSLAVVMLLVFLAVRGSWVRMGRVAHGLRTGSGTKTSFRDQSEISELDDIASEFDHLVTSLRRGAEHVRHRAEDTAHALKTPLAIMRQTLLPLRGELAATNKRVARALEVMEQAVERLDNLVDEARLPDDPDAEAADLQSGRVDLSRLLRQMLKGYQELAEGRGIHLEVALPAGLTVAGSEAQIRAAIEAVLYDMILSSPPGRRIEVQLLRTSVKAEIAVAGDGPRIPPRYGNEIFDSGLAWNAKTDSAKGGRSESGIGLGWARRKLQAMGGGMRVENAPGQEGVLVFLDVPVLGAPPTGRQLRRTLVLGIQSGREKGAA